MGHKSEDDQRWAELIAPSGILFKIAHYECACAPVDSEKLVERDAESDELRALLQLLLGFRRPLCRRGRGQRRRGRRNGCRRDVPRQLGHTPGESASRKVASDKHAVGRTRLFPASVAPFAVAGAGSVVADIDTDAIGSLHVISDMRRASQQRGRWRWTSKRSA